MTYSTYNEIIDDVISDINEPTAMAVVAPELIQSWINRWQHFLSLKVDVQGEADLDLVEDETDYPLSFIPDEIRKIVYIQRENNTFLGNIEIIDMYGMMEKERTDARMLTNYTDSVAPFYAAIWTNAKDPYLRVYPAPKADETVRVYYLMTIDARAHNSDALTADILVPSRYDEALIWGVKSEVFDSILKDPKRKNEALNHFEQIVNLLKIVPQSETKITMVYK